MLPLQSKTLVVDLDLVEHTQPLLHNKRSHANGFKSGRYSRFLLGLSWLTDLAGVFTKVSCLKVLTAHTHNASTHHSCNAKRYNMFLHVFAGWAGPWLQPSNCMQQKALDVTGSQPSMEKLQGSIPTVRLVTSKTGAHWCLGFSLCQSLQNSSRNTTVQKNIGKMRKICRGSTAL